MTANLQSRLGLDTIWINGTVAPGQWILQPGYKEYGWQIQQGFALSGATVFPKGDELMVAPFLIRLWDVDPRSPNNQYPAWLDFRARFLKKAVYTVAGALVGTALGVVHAELNAMGGTQWVVKRVPWLTNNGKGLWTGVCELLQYRKPLPALNKPNPAIPGASTPVPTAQDKLQAQILANSQKIAQLRDGP
jgi:hypothetical protein